ncbi:hypothetical protein NQ318_008234 [Aromia moschata]|uniref:Uncharacterized protein n=1 Tax=Aromia moschata TaxID=1265417 RepID=A0AAV8Y6W3_9CUCU|nr:hypothetical protein NQ318_008234 [Aromia moschata]
MTKTIIPIIVSTTIKTKAIIQLIVPPKNRIIIQATENTNEIQNPQIQVSQDNALFSNQISIDPRTEQISKFKCNLINTEAILLATEIEKVHLPNAIVKNSIIPVKPIFTVALTKLLDALEENIIGKDYLKMSKTL